MRVKRTTYGPRSGNDEITNLSLEIKQIIKQLQEGLKKNKMKIKIKIKILDDYAKAIQNLKGEYQTVSAEKKQVERFFTKKEQEKQRAKQNSLIKQHAK